MIEVRGLTRRFGDFTAVHPFELTVEPGRITGLLGPNGSGKSTLMRMMLGLVRPDAGSCRIADVPLAGDGTAIRQVATYAPGELAVYREMTAYQQLAWLLRKRDEGALPRAVRMLEDLGLPLERRVHGYSHGMKRVLFLAAALAPDVPVRVLDEPTEGLDPSRRGEVLELLREEASRGTTILLSSHHLGEVDLACDRVLFLRDGTLLDETQANELRARFQNALRMEWTEPVEEAPLAEALAGLGELRVHENQAVLFLEEPDPRTALAAFARAQELPAPRQLGYGQLRLSELYRELYGREGV